ncbi:MAG: carboxypeptidase-like regulatory domain-containing protein, partial [Gemmatimonadales bacterium]
PSRVPMLRKRIALDLDSVPVHAALQKLSRLSGLRFIYADDVVDADRVVHLKARDITVAAALTEVLIDAAVAVVIRPDGDAVLVPAATGFATHDTTSIVTGTVTDAAGEPLGDAEVYVVTSGRAARADATGRYAVGQLLQGPTRLRARVPGWEPADTEVVLASHGAATINFVLKPHASNLAPVTVTSGEECPRQSLDGFTCRRRLGLGVFRDAREIAALTPIYFADIFDGVAGVRRIPLPLDEGIEATTQWRCIVYLENGRVPSWTNVMRVNFLDIVAFEFYDTQEAIPEWYKSYAWSGHEPCSLIVLWMRGAPEVAK